MKLSIFLALTSLIILASAAPIPHDGSPVASIEYETTPINQKRDVAEVDSQLSRTINRYSNSLNNFKNNVGKPSKIAKATKPKARKSPASSSSKRAMIDLTEVNDGLFWTGPVTAGSAPDTLQMNFDSGSADTFVNPGKFKTSKKSTGPFRVAYMDGSWTSGDIYMENLSIAGLQIKSQAIGAATSNTFAGMDGISGVGFKSVSAFNQAPWTDTAKAQGVIKKNILGFGLSSTKARLDIGGFSSAYNGKIKYAPVDTSSGFFQIPGAINGMAVSTIIDTGTTLVITSLEQATSLCQKAGGETINNYNGDILCQYDPNNPLKMNFTFGGTTYTMSADSLHYADFNGKAIASIIGADIGVDSVIVGDSFLRNVYTVFDKDDSRVGFAKRSIA